MKKKFKKQGMFESNENYKIATKRLQDIYLRKDDYRDIFTRDYTRILFCQGYRRLKHKTQVFLYPDNDHICTRAEHVSLVESVSSTIALNLGLNENLTKAISIGHDIGHAPFGHGGEKIIKELREKEGLGKFYHEMNSLYFVDNIETLDDTDFKTSNLNLTYAVRDGIVCHCGEELKQSIVKRDEYIDLADYKIPGQFEPYTWEGCVVKMSDKIAYLARDIEDALTLKIINESDLHILSFQINQIDEKVSIDTINNGTIINYFIHDICKNSSLEQGICLSDTAFKIMQVIMKFNYEKIYIIDRVKVHHNYVTLMIHSIYDQLLTYYKYAEVKDRVLFNLEHHKYIYPLLIESFLEWLYKYSDIQCDLREHKYNNQILYKIKDFVDYKEAILSYISGMTDSYIILLFNELIKI